MTRRITQAYVWLCVRLSAAAAVALSAYSLMSG